MSSTARYWQQLENPWAQGVLGGALALIPARKWPRWVRGVYTWVPTIGAASLAAAPEVWSRWVKESSQGSSLGEQPPEGAAARDARPAEHIGVGERDLHRVRQHAVDVAESAPGLTVGQGASRLAAAVALGGMTYGAAKLSLWADGALEDGLRRLNVPAPRLTLAVACGVAFAWIATIDGGERAGDALSEEPQEDDDASVEDEVDVDDESLDHDSPEDD
ncbi:MAG TPA: hypothetical protein H9871_02625 [Candidatus Nesterenkonia stercoripullorum]|uniref:Uncharacterized protein n=1 Tax=Candidatus Nesterenkonia stercoripullorum TaxID=2838701 RepID=A0A9D1S316_9MICC|nr:hypothetical protein [Candidatus Nesterenkonia stercoripullorum]